MFASLLGNILNCSLRHFKMIVRCLELFFWSEHVFSNLDKEERIVGHNILDNLAWKCDFPTYTYLPSPVQVVHLHYTLTQSLQFQHWLNPFLPVLDII